MTDAKHMAKGVRAERDAPGAPADALPRSARPAAWDDATLVAAVRAGDERAIAELYARLLPLLLHEARHLGVQPGLRREVAADVVRTVYFAIVHPGRPAPRSLAAYAVRALHRYRWLLRRMERRALDSIDAGAAAARSALDQADATEAEGEQPSPGDGWFDAGTPQRTPVARLALALATRLTAGERQLLGWMADHVPYRTMAGWCGISYDAMHSRAARLREKARRIALAWIRERPPDEQARLLRHLTRTADSDHQPGRHRLTTTRFPDRGAQDDAP